MNCRFSALFFSLILAGCGPIQRKALFFPTHSPDLQGLAEWKNGETLIGVCREVKDAGTVWLFMHGNAGQAADRRYALPRFSSTDAVYILEYPGYGLRPGIPSRRNFDQAALEAYHLLRAQFPNKRICAIGESIGTGPTCSIASDGHPPDKIVLVVPFDDLKSVAAEHTSYLPVGLILGTTWNNIEALKGFTGPVEIYGAAEDTVIPVFHAKRLAASVPNAKLCVVPGGHNDWSRQSVISIRYP